jgi:hypothetical protein
MSKIGENVGYTVLKADKWGGWDETPTISPLTIGQAAAQVDAYTRDNPGASYAIARLTLVMIVRPSDA